MNSESTHKRLPKTNRRAVHYWPFSSDDLQLHPWVACGLLHPHAGPLYGIQGEVIPSHMRGAAVIRKVRDAEVIRRG